MTSILRNISSINQKQCLSCRSCYLTCGNHAIEMKENEEGFFYPYVNDKCINCGLCVLHCPIFTPLTNSEYHKESYISFIKDEKKLFESTSGGIFVVIAENILLRNGVVFGAAYDKELNVKQIPITTKKELIMLKGSKYVESNTNDSYQKVKQLLQNDIDVLYSGTACQIAGLKKYLNIDYQNLYCIDIVCHGVPSNKLFHKYLDWLGKKIGGKIIYYGFRDKDVAGWSCGGKVKTKTKTKTKTIDGTLDPYYTSFLRCETYRESCYFCPFQTSDLNRPGDVTLGDFFEIDKFYPNIDKTKGISICLINTAKGKQLFNLIKDNITAIPIETNSYTSIKSNMIMPSKRPEIRNYIYNGIEKLTVNEYFSKYKEASFIYRTKERILRKILKYIPRSVKDDIKSIVKK